VKELRLLIVEDAPLVGPTTRAILKREGHHVAGVATTPIKTHRLVRRARADLALIDLKLADGGRGLDVARQLRGELGVSCLIITGYQLRAHEVGKAALGILHKPFSPAAPIKAVAVAGELLAGRPPSMPRRSLNYADIHHLAE
jgi:two-component system, response regulator PdtaR